MNKDEFLNRLKNSLTGLTEAEKKDILYDYEEHFSIGLEKGKTESEICESLGDPKTIAKQFRAEYAVKRAEENKSTVNIIRAIIAALSLGFFNLVFMLGPFIALVVIIITFFIVSGVIAVTGLAIIPLSFLSNSFVNPAAGFFIAIGTTALGLLMFLGSFCLAKLFYNLTIAYLKLNLKIIIKQEANNA
ncbi:MAG TPA: DUF1700 domain-containing protein [Bacillota bacterium]|nr:DUF1700 domain-containing protein [Bacillota bacterium]HOL08631.1 DUF1700 domain-containing protein [Bacillota bacterium]HPO96667.1 DUF1700 domain-containing protein [Bacillota bacterium]